MIRGHARGRHVQQFQLALLELERTRLLRDRGAAQRRMAEIDARLQSLQASVETLHVALGLRSDAAADPARAARPEPQRLRIRY